MRLVTPGAKMVCWIAISPPNDEKADVTAFSIYMGFWFPQVDRWIFPNGFEGLLASFTVVMFAFGGIDTLAAGRVHPDHRVHGAGDRRPRRLRGHRFALHVGAVWLGLLVLAYRFWVKGNGRRRADLVDETSPLPVVTIPVSAGSQAIDPQLRQGLSSGMVPFTNLLAFALASLVLIAIPGPSVLFVVGRSLALGRKGGLLSVLGNALGMVPQIIAVATGVGIVLAQSVALFTIIKFAGAAYLAYLGIQAIRHRGGGSTAAGGVPPSSTWRMLREGFLVGATNPKSIVFFVAVLPQFVDYQAGNIPLQLATLGGVFLVIALVSDSTWALAAGTARQWFARSPKRISTLSTAGGVMMIGLGGTLALTGSKS